MALRLGADTTLDPVSEEVTRRVLGGTEGRGVDFVIVATGNPKAIQQAITSVRSGGKVVLFGVPARGTLVSLDLSRLFLQEIGIQSSYSTSETEMQMALELIESKRIQPSQLITHRLPLERTVEAFHLAENGKETVKVIVENQ